MAETNVSEQAPKEQKPKDTAPLHTDKTTIPRLWNTLSNAGRTVGTTLRKMLPSLDFDHDPSKRTLFKAVALGAIVMESGAACSILSSEDTREINMADKDRFPTECPPEIRAASRGVVDVGIHLDEGGQKSIVSLSGVVVGPDYVVTSGHGIRDAALGVVWNDLPGTDIDYGAVVGLSKDGTEVRRKIQRTSSVFLPSEENPKELRDLALLEMDHDITELPHLQISTDKMRIGDPLFFVDYGPDGDDPDTTRYPSSPNKPFKRPATYLGVLVGFTREDKYGQTFPVVMTFRNLGEGDAEEEARHGSSGGAVLRSDTKVAGNIRMFGSTDPMSPADVEAKFNIKLNGLTDKERAGSHRLCIFQPITTTDIEQLAERLKTQPTSGPNRWAAPRRTTTYTPPGN